MNPKDKISRYNEILGAMERDLTQVKYAVPQNVKSYKDSTTFWFMFIYLLALIIGSAFLIAKFVLYIRGGT